VTALTLPAVSAPRITVAMAVHDAPGWTRRAIEALIANTQPIYELAIVDDASREPETAELLASLEGARVERNASGEGFGPASNRAAAGARGEHVLLLNTDALVQPGWLEPMLARMEDPGVGAVAPMLLNVDGTVQQAGAIVARDGSTRIYGDGSAPDAGPVAFSRTVDYAAAACLLVRRDAFEALGGFDPLFAPAYFEDADLCLRLAARGLRTVYEPRARVVHGLGATYGSQAIPDFAARNRERFAERWRAVLEARPGVIDDRRPWLTIASRDAPAAARLLVLDEVAPDAGRRLADQDPGILVTIASGAADPSDGVEALGLRADELTSLLRDRRFHYEAIVADGPLPHDVEAAVATWQPQAIRPALAELLRPGGLAAAGLG
jgi:GT2 family glycosyltransferase